MAKQPIISVILPIYNVELYLSQCLESVYAQKVEGGMEVICVNDGSTDGSRVIIQEFKDKYPLLIHIDRDNGGLPAARNTGFNVATGKYIYFLDSDDYLYPGALRQMVEFTENNNLDIANFNVLKDGKDYYFINKTDINEVFSGKEYYRLNYEINGFFPPSAVWSNLYKRDFIIRNNLKFKEGIEHEDEEYTPRAYFFAQRVASLNIPIQFHRIMRKGSVTEATLLMLKERNIQDVIDTSADLFIFFRKHNYSGNAFYHKIFLNYLAMAKIITEKKPERKKFIFRKSDYRTMSSCAISWDWYIYYWLFRYNTNWFKWYINSGRPFFIQKLINKIFKIVYFPKLIR